MSIVNCRFRNLRLITIIGLGPADAGGLSMAARDALRAANPLLLRTERHPAVEFLFKDGVQFEALDHFYEGADSFDSLYSDLANHVLRAAELGDVAYAVPGHPLVAEESVKRLLAGARERKIAVRI